MQDEGLRFLCSKAEIIDELETTLPHWMKARSWYPPFVHVLKFHPSTNYDVNLNALWNNIGLMENNLLNAQQETRLRVEEIEDRVGDEVVATASDLYGYIMWPSHHGIHSLHSCVLYVRVQFLHIT